MKAARCAYVASGFIVFSLSLGLATAGTESDPDKAMVRRQVQDGTVHVQAFDLPLSASLSSETRAALKREVAELAAFRKRCRQAISLGSTATGIVALRACMAEHYYPAIIARHRARYPVTIRAERIAGVPTEIFTPADGVSEQNRTHVLINLHGGGFSLGGRWGGQIESIPIAALGKVKVISVDYRMAPEYHFPAASEDVAAVYRALLADYKPQDIGIYGCSAGGLLTAEAVAWFQKENLPAPGAVGMFCAGAFPWGGGDSNNIAAAIAKVPNDSPTVAASAGAVSYFSPANSTDPLAFPGLSTRVLAAFPHSLLITSTRDHLMSEVVATHTQLVKSGVEADLYVWEGLGHAFFNDPELPESREVYAVIARFFNEHLSAAHASK